MEPPRQNTKQTFLSGVMLLTLSTVLVKGIGLIYKIPMLSYLGSEGMGYFNSAYEIYALFCVISTAGLPVALSVLISSALAKKQYRAVSVIYRSAWTVFLIIGVFGSAIMLLFARTFCRLIQSENAYFCILSIAPTVFFVCYSSAVRGYFQGHQKMLPTAVSQLIESVGKLVFGLLLSRFALNRGADTPMVAAYAGIGLTIGTALSAAYLLLCKRLFDRKQKREDHTEESEPDTDNRTVWRELARLAIPMTLGASLVSVTKLIDMTMILRRLQFIGMSEIRANEIYGSYTTLALSVFGLLPTLINAVALPLLPMLSAAISAGDRERERQMVHLSYQLTALLSLPASLGLSAFSRPVLSLLFGNNPAVAVAAPLLSCLGISVFLSCMITATNSILHAYRSVRRPILSMLAGAAVKLLTAYFLIGNPSIGILGAPISTFFCNATVVGLNLYFASSMTGDLPIRDLLLRPLTASALSVGAVSLLFQRLSNGNFPLRLLTILALGCTVLLYFLLSCLLGVFSIEDLLALPGGEKASHLFRSIRNKCKKQQKNR